MMKIRSLLAVMVLMGAGACMAQSISVSSSRGLQHFNPQVLGTSVDDSINPLLPWRLTDIRPSDVSLSLTSNRYTGATLTFPREITLREAIRSIQTTFMQCKPVSEDEPLSWGESESGFTITLAEQTNAFLVTYTGIRPPRKPTVKDGKKAETRIQVKGL